MLNERRALSKRFGRLLLTIRHRVNHDLVVVTSCGKHLTAWTELQVLDPLLVILVDVDNLPVRGLEDSQ